MFFDFWCKGTTFFSYNQIKNEKNAKKLENDVFFHFFAKKFGYLKNLYIL